MCKKNRPTPTQTIFPSLMSFGEKCKLWNDRMLKLYEWVGEVFLEKDWATTWEHSFKSYNKVKNPKKEECMPCGWKTLHKNTFTRYYASQKNPSNSMWWTVLDVKNILLPNWHRSARRLCIISKFCDQQWSVTIFIAIGRFTTFTISETCEP